MTDLGDFDKLHTPGKIVVYDAFTSTSTEMYDDSMDIQMIITSTRGRDMRKYNPGELEMLFPRESAFYAKEIRFT